MCSYFLLRELLLSLTQSTDPKITIYLAKSMGWIGTMPIPELVLIIVFGSRLNIKTVFPRYGDSHVKDNTVTGPSYH